MAARAIASTSSPIQHSPGGVLLFLLPGFDLSAKQGVVHKEWVGKEFAFWKRNVKKASGTEEKTRGEERCEQSSLFFSRTIN